jgi:hypothetical protein
MNEAIATLLLYALWQGQGKHTFIPFLGMFANLQTAAISFHMSVRLSARPHRTTQGPSGRIFVKFGI